MYNRYMKKFIDDKYAAVILQLAHKYLNENPQDKSDRMYHAMSKTLETMDMYVAWINNMGFMMYQNSIEQMIVYIDSIKYNCTEFSTQQLREVENYLKSLIA